MANNCMNEVVITGPKKEIDKIEKRFPKHLNFKKIIPEPRYAAVDRQGGFTCDWRAQHWGTKWNCSDAEENEDDQHNRASPKTLTYCFDSAWSPPSPAIKELSKQHPKVIITLEFDEPGYCSAGIETYEAGELIEETDLSSKYDKDPQETDENDE